MIPLVTRWVRPAAMALALCCGLATAQDLRDPPDQTFTVWPNIPVIRASDLGDYGQDRKIFADLHTAKADFSKHRHLVADGRHGLEELDRIFDRHVEDIGNRLPLNFTSSVSRL